jgi:hypothetical protein
MAVVAVRNVSTDANGNTVIDHLSAAKSASPGRGVTGGSMTAVVAALVAMWLLYRYAIKPHPISLVKSFVPYAGVLAVTAALERFLEPLSQLLMPSTAVKTQAAQSTSTAQAAAADPAMSVPAVQDMVTKAAADQAVAEALNTNRTILFWAIASVCGLAISGAFGLFLLQSVATGPVNSFLDLAVTGLTIGAGTKPTHDLITSLQAKSSSASGAAS